MAGKKKLQQFAEIREFPNVMEVSYAEVLNRDHELKGRWNERVFKNGNPIILELGCGKGEYTVGLARKHPEQNFIGVDIKGARMWRGAKTALEEGLKNVYFLRTRIEFIASFFAEGEVDEIWLTFPDPQPRKSREKKRLTSPNFLDKYKEILNSGGLLHLKTDSAPLYQYSCEVIPEEGFVIEESTNDLYGNLSKLKVNKEDCDILNIRTFYEQMFAEKGHTITYLKSRYAG